MLVGPLAATFIYFATLSACGRCDCQPPSSLRMAADSADAIVWGWVEREYAADAPQSPTGTREHRVLFRADVSWKMEPLDRVLIATPIAPSACGVSFEAGHHYLVFLSTDEGKYRTTRCTGTRLAGDDDPALQELTDALGRPNEMPGPYVK